MKPQTRLAARLKARKELHAIRCRRRAVGFPGRFNLSSSKAIEPFGSLTFEHLRIKVALSGVVNHAVFDAVNRITGLNRRLVNDREFLHRNATLRVSQRLKTDPNRGRQEMSPIIRRGSGDDAIVVFRKLLRLFQPLLSPEEHPTQYV